MTRAGSFTFSTATTSPRPTPTSPKPFRLPPTTDWKAVFIGFEFHPEFAENGLFYTVHGEYALDNPATPDFIPPGFTAADVTYHNVITEWRATVPSANTFDGTRRELLRVAHVVDSLTHPFRLCRV